MLLPILLVMTAALFAQPSASPAARVAGRVVIGADGTAELIGIYTHIQGVKTPLFNSKETSEKDAFFSFRTARTAVKIVPDGKAFKMTPLDPNGTLSIYYHPLPNRDYKKPDTFTEVQLVATFRSRDGAAVIVPGGEFTYTGEIELDSSSDFVAEGVRLNFRDFGSSFRLRATGTSPSFEAIMRQALEGGMTIAFTGSASPAAETATR